MKQRHCYYTTKILKWYFKFIGFCFSSIHSDSELFQQDFPFLYLLMGILEIIPNMTILLEKKNVNIQMLY